ncbi:hypothetical protein MMC17_004508 [Xylographa soralifera]|nr:hypothetical protein [Xylographa soralifera]
MSGGSASLWLLLLNDKKSRFVEQGYKSSLATTTESAFREAFEAICPRYKEYRGVRLLATLARSYTYIIAFANFAGGAVKDLPSNGLAGVIWGSSLAVSGCKAGAKIDGLVNLLVELNSSVPAFGSNVTTHADEPTTQSPLQDIFGEYINTHLFMISWFTKRSPLSVFDPTQDTPLRSHIAETIRKFEDAKSRHEAAVALADEKRAKQRLLEQQSNRNGQKLTNGYHEDYNTQAQFVRIKTLGAGSFGDVDEVQEKSTGTTYARKYIPFHEGSASAMSEKEVKKEIGIMQKLRHQNIVSLLLPIREPRAYSVLMLPVADENLKDFLDRCIEDNFRPSLIKLINPWFGCLLNALAYAHKQKICHKDIKPRNILIKGDECFLSDFGLARDFTGHESSATQSHFVEGTPAYFAPEVRPDQARGRPADIFALGCVFSEMFSVSKQRSLDELRQQRRKSSIASNQFVFRDNLDEVKEWLNQFEINHMTGLLVDQILIMLSVDPNERPTAQKLVYNLRGEPAFFCEE